MSVANRPIDLLLSADNARVSQSQRRETSQGNDVSLSKIRESSFDDVYRQQRREDSEARQTSQTDKRNESRARAEDRADDRRQQSKLAAQSAEDKRSQRDAQGVANGKALPQERSLSAADAADREAKAGGIDAESLLVGLVQNTEDMSPDAQAFSEQELDQIELGSSFIKEGAIAGEQSVDSLTLAGLETAQDIEQQELELAQQADEAAEQELKQLMDGVPSLQAAQNQQGKESKQSTLGDAAESGVKNSVNAGSGSVNKPSTAGAEHSGQFQLQDRFSSSAEGQEFKVLREQLNIANSKVATDKAPAVDAATSTDSAADRLPRLNALTQSTQVLGQARPGTVTTSVQTPVNSAEWGQAMSQRIIWLANRGISGAELQLNPRELGPVDVRINVNGEQASVQFTSQHAAVRDVLESSMAKLREMMESNGLSLVDVDVSDQSHSEQAQSGSNAPSDIDSTNGGDGAEGSSDIQTVQRIESDGLVDFYA